MSVGAADSRPARMVQQAASPIYNQKSRLITYHIQWCNWKHRRQSHIRSLKTRAESAFHQSRLKKTHTGVGVEKHPLQLQIRYEPFTDIPFFHLGDTSPAMIPEWDHRESLERKVGERHGGSTLCTSNFLVFEYPSIKAFVYIVQNCREG